MNLSEEQTKEVIKVLERIEQQLYEVLKRNPHIIPLVTNLKLTSEHDKKRKPIRKNKILDSPL